MARAALISATVLIAPGVALALVCGGCSKLQEKALREHSLSMCESVPHEAGASCSVEVSRRFAHCSPALLQHRVSSETYARCLGFLINSSDLDPAR